MLDKTGLLTTEFWMSAVSTLFLAVFGVLIIYNILTEEQAAAWMSLAVAVTAIVIPLAIAAVLIVPPLFVAWSLARVAADADRAMESAFDDECAACDGQLEYDTEEASMCINCGLSTYRRVRS
jgi:hypothetical protein